MELFIKKEKLNVIACKSLLDQFIGLRFKKIKQSQAYLFPIKFPALAVVDTFFVPCSIDIAFLDKNFYILNIKRNVKPYSVMLVHPRTKFILELKPGKKLNLGSKVHITN